MALPALPIILGTAAVSLPFLAALFGEKGKEIRPLYRWETELGRETLDLIRAFQPRTYPGELTVPITVTEQALAQALAQPLYLEPAQQYITRALAGEFLRPEAHPYLQRMQQALEREAERVTRRALEDIGGAVQRAGVPGGSAEMTMRQRTAESVAQQIADRLAGLYGGLYQQERALQQALLPYYLQYTLAPLQQALAGLEAQRYLRQAMLQNILLPYQEWVRTRQEALIPLQARLQLLGLPAEFPQYRLPDWYYLIAPLSQGLAVGAGYAAGSGGLGGGGAAGGAGAGAGAGAGGGTVGGGVG